MTLPILRVARACVDLERLARQYRDGLELVELGRFADHDGFDGVLLGQPHAPYHLELVHERNAEPPPAPHHEQALVFYFPDCMQWAARCAAMERAGFVRVGAANPYWERSGRSYQDSEGGRVIVQHAAWTA